MRRLVLASVAAAALVLSACASATVDNTVETPAAAPSADVSLERNADLDATATEVSPAPNAPAPAATPQPQDQGAREIEDIPDTPPREETEQVFLDGVAAGGVDVAGVEDQLIGAARAACNQQDQVTVQAIAGQLIEQGRTDREIGDVITLIEDTARTGYCQ